MRSLVLNSWENTSTDLSGTKKKREEEQPHRYDDFNLSFTPLYTYSIRIIIFLTIFIYRIHCRAHCTRMLNGNINIKRKNKFKIGFGFPSYGHIININFRAMVYMCATWENNLFRFSILIFLVYLEGKFSTENAFKRACYNKENEKEMERERAYLF